MTPNDPTGITVGHDTADHVATCGRPVKPPLYLWTSDPDESELELLRVEVCSTCAALVPLASFDTHGRWHTTADPR